MVDKSEVTSSHQGTVARICNTRQKYRCINKTENSQTKYLIRYSKRRFTQKNSVHNYFRQNTKQNIV